MRGLIVRSLKFIGVLMGVMLVAASVQHFRLSEDSELSKPKARDVIRFSSYNVHYIVAGRRTGAWSVGEWEKRKQPLADTVSALNADIIGFQEMETFTWDNTDDFNLAREWILESLPIYKAGAVGDAAEFPSTQPILYRAARFDLLDQGWFFFSNTPDKIYSPTFNGTFPSFASWVYLKDKRSAKLVRVVNVHLDVGSSDNRIKSAELVRKRIQPWLEDGEAVVVLGDYNSFEGSSALSVLQEAGITYPRTNYATFHFDVGINLFCAIDHVGFSSAFRLVRQPAVFQKKLGSIWPSDHYPIIVDLVQKVH